MRKLARALKHRALNWLEPDRKKNSEVEFWRNELAKYQQWFLGELSCLYYTPSPKEDEKVPAPNLKDASILTWHKLHQEPKYLQDLRLAPNTFAGKRLLDIGAGPIPSASCFKQAELYSLDPSLADYLTAGYPLHYYGGVRFVHSFAESIPVPDSYFDAVIAVNSIDHVDDIQKTAEEIHRVLKPGGQLRMHIHYHRATVTEPIELNDSRVARLFSWCPSFQKLGSFSESYSTRLSGEEQFALWSSFQ